MERARSIQFFLLAEALSFVCAGLVHFGVLVEENEHLKAGVAEGVIGIVLLLGLVLIRVRSKWTHTVGVVTQAFALFGTCIGLFTIAIGVGPRTVPDIAYHIVTTIVLVWGLIVAANDTDRVVDSR